jgi:hypothetical protein
MSARERLRPGPIWSLREVLEKHAYFFVSAVMALEDFKYICAAVAQQDAQEQVSPHVKRIADFGILELRKAFILSDLSDRIGPLDRLHDALNPTGGAPEMPASVLGQQVKFLAAEVRDLLETTYYFHVSAEDVPLYMGSVPTWPRSSLRRWRI